MVDNTMLIMHILPEVLPFSNVTSILWFCGLQSHGALCWFCYQSVAQQLKKGEETLGRGEGLSAWVEGKLPAR